MLQTDSVGVVGPGIMNRGSPRRHIPLAWSDLDLPRCLESPRSYAMLRVQADNSIDWRISDIRGYARSLQVGGMRFLTPPIP